MCTDATYPSLRPERRRVAVLWLVLVGTLAGVLSLDPIAQDSGYHNFADGRTLLGVPNFLNVASNLPFLIIGLIGLMGCRRTCPAISRDGWSIFFLGVTLTCVGSGYYHFAPGDAALTWDRLPMTLAFMGLLSALVSEHLSLRHPRRWLVAAVLIGIASVLWWRYANDLRPYVWVQGVPLLVIPVTLLLFPPRYTHRSYLLYGLGFYAFAKITEFGDAPIFTLSSHAISGHSLKHLLAALAPLYVYLMLRRRGSAPTPPVAG